MGDGPRYERREWGFSLTKASAVEAEEEVVEDEEERREEAALERRRCSDRERRHSP